jgi:hypothetical protein
MKKNREPAAAGAELDQPPFLYEIRVKGRLSAEQWASWFDGLTVSTTGGESTLRGRVPDHAALYGLLARLRDLAIPLLAVRVLDAQAQLELSRQGRRYDLLINLLMVALYLLLLGGLGAIAVWVTSAIHVALVLTLLFALLGGLSHAFWLWTDQPAWRWLSYTAWLAAAGSLLIFIPVSDVLPPEMGIAIILFLLAGGLTYLIYALRRRAADVDARLAGRGEPPAGLSAEANEETGRDDPREVS